MIPALPIESVREAVARDDWATAEALLAQHEAAVRAACTSESLAQARHRESWAALLAAQRGLADELRAARDEAARALDCMGQGRRGMAAYRQGAQ